MNFELSQDHKVLQSAVRDFVEKEIKPIAMKMTKFMRFPMLLSKRWVKWVFSVATSRRNMAGLDMLSYAIVVEGVSKVWVSSGVLIPVSYLTV